MFRPIAAAILLLTGCDSAPGRNVTSPGPDLSGLVWIDPAPDLRGKVALVRWWTDG